MIQALLTPALAIVNTGVDYSNYQPLHNPKVVAHRVSAFSLIPKATLSFHAELVYSPTNKMVYMINGRADRGLRAFDVTTHEMKLLAVIEAKTQSAWGEAPGELLLCMTAVQRDRILQGRNREPVYDFLQYWREVSICYPVSRLDVPAFKGCLGH
ncbi:hypothetical protein BDV26DRAFT_298291 [Aspergillus bertholletiae]|uniref:Uncharacterized protein n=1 Tax=Aspergillus bertholletiae TaxID=1226010 RepID=A0A5N7AT90_9EURO|nr:hypothetical protein BDV26DRAFT_298291 [Aspergillus bertholletiae]